MYTLILNELRQGKDTYIRAHAREKCRGFLRISYNIPLVAYVFTLYAMLVNKDMCK